MRATTRRLLTFSLIVCTMALAFSAATAGGAINRTDGTYVLDMPLSKPTPIRPADGTAMQYPTDSIKIAWRPVPGAAKYDVQVAQQPGSTSHSCNSAEAWQVENILFTHTTTELGWVPELLDKATGSDIWTGTFCWRVRASGTTPGLWSTSARFTISWPAKATSLRFFADESGAIPRAGAGDSAGFDTGYLEWSAISGASRYEIQISEAPSFSIQSLFATKVYPGTRMLLPQMPDNNYSWRVRPIAGNGVRGTWSDVATFTIQRDTRYWTSDAESLYPAHNATVKDVRFGYEPVPGASYYRYMASTTPSGFTELDSNAAYGAVVSDGCGFGNSRLSPFTEAESSTINNWVTFAALFDPEVVKNLYSWCAIDPNPDVDGDETYTRPSFPSPIYWRVYPVWQLSSATETGWNVETAKIVGSAVQRRMNIVPYTAADTTDPTIGMVDNNACRGTVTRDCLRHIGGAMSPKNTSTHSTTMQIPYFEFGAYRGVDDGFPNGAGPGGHRIQIARDSAFNNQVLPPAANNLIRGWMSYIGPVKRDARAGSSVGGTRFGQYIRSFALTSGLPDEGQDGNGYFWRGLPCESGDAYEGGPFLCSPDMYSDLTDDNWSPGLRFGTPGSGALEFRKRVEVSTTVVPDFSAGMPMLQVGPVGASTYLEWQRGIQGADHYEFELARTQAFDDADVLKTTVPRIVPWGEDPDDLLEPGTWFWRVRAVDRDGLTGTWSAASSFSVTAPSPVVSTSSDTLGVGATVEWSPVPGATQYEISWSTDSGFGAGTTTKTTRQTAYYIPSTTPGSYVWRVRAQIGEESFGAWTTSRQVTILSPSRIPFGMSRSINYVGQTAIVESQLVVAGTPRNGQRVSLQRKTTSCEGGGGYRPFAAGTTGDRVDDGVVRFRVRVTHSACYRLAWTYATGTMFSAAFELGARPVVSFRPMTRRVRRGQNFCSTIVSRSTITGRLRIEYKVGTKWVTARTANVRGMRGRRQCAAINRGGNFPVRLVLDRMVHPRGRWQIFEPTYVNNGSIRTNDAFTIIR